MGFDAKSLIKQLNLDLLEELFDKVPEIVFFIKDQFGRYLVVNQSLVERHGLTDKSQAIGKRPVDISPGNFGGIPVRQDDSVLATGKPLVDHLELHWYAPERPGWCLTTKLPIVDSEGKVIGLVGVSRDVRSPVEVHDIPTGLADALDYFEQNLSISWTPVLIAKRAKLPVARFARLMKRFYGMTPSQYIMRKRISNASRLLRETNETIASITHLCGYVDQSAFTRTFRKMTGKTPKEFRG